MSLTTDRPNAATTAPATMAPATMAVESPARRLPPRRRSPMLAALGVLLVVLGALGAWVIVGALTSSGACLAVAQDAPVGTKITAAHLRVVQVNSPVGLAPIKAAERDTVIGRYAKVDLVPGTLLTAAQLTDTAFPGPGENLVGLELKPSQLPGQALRRGDKVLLVITPDQRAVNVDPKASSAQPLTTPPTVKATVVNVGAPQTDGQVVVDVVLPQADGPTVVALAAQGRIALAVTPRS
jgi:hypothetical protein